MRKKIKALVLLSGGLDSRLAVKLMQKQGIDVIAINAFSTIELCGSKRTDVEKFANETGISLYFIDKGQRFFDMIKKPKYGHGKNMNPCIDCRIHLFKLAKKHMKKLGAKFIVTGEVLDQRPMSQYKNTMLLIERDAGVQGLVLRPLSARLLPKTIPEKKGWVDRKKLLAIRGRRRLEQMALAKKFKISYPSPGGGCVLTYPEFAKKVRDFITFNKTFTKSDGVLLRVGRHFRFGKNKIIVGRNHKENLELIQLKKPDDWLFEAKNVVGPTSLLQGPKTKTAIKLSAELTARYSDSKLRITPILYGVGLKQSIKVQKVSERKVKKYMITK